MTKSVRERISWTRSDSELAKRQRTDSAIKIIICALERYGVNLEDSHCTFGKNPISKEEAQSWGTSKHENSVVIGRILRHLTEYCIENGNLVTE